MKILRIIGLALSFFFFAIENKELADGGGAKEDKKETERILEAKPSKVQYIEVAQQWSIDCSTHSIKNAILGLQILESENDPKKVELLKKEN